jgi:predicted patatin/cPLA2 family phospholipase
MERRICYIESLIKLAGFSKLSGGRLPVILSKSQAKNYPKTTLIITLKTTQETTPKTTREMPKKTSKSPQKERLIHLRKQRICHLQDTVNSLIIRH